MAANRLIVEKERVEKFRIDKTDLAIGVAIAVILVGVAAASFTETYLLETHPAVAAQDQGHSADSTALAATILTRTRKEVDQVLRGCPKHGNSRQLAGTPRRKI